MHYFEQIDLDPVNTKVQFVSAFAKIEVHRNITKHCSNSFLDPQCLIFIRNYKLEFS